MSSEARKDEGIEEKKRGFKEHCKSLIENCKQMPNDILATKSFIALLEDLKKSLADQNGVKAYIAVHRMIDYCKKTQGFNVKNLPDFFVDFTCKIVEQDLEPGKSKYYAKLYNENGGKDRDFLATLLKVEKHSHDYFVELMYTKIDIDDVAGFKEMIEFGGNAGFILEKQEYDDFYEEILAQGRQGLKKFFDSEIMKSPLAADDKALEEDDDDHHTIIDHGGSDADAEDSVSGAHSPEVHEVDIHSDSKGMINTLIHFARKGNVEYVRTIFETHAGSESELLKQGASLKTTIDSLIRHVARDDVNAISRIINELLPDEKLIEPEVLMPIIEQALQARDEVASLGTQATFAVAPGAALKDVAVPNIGRKNWERDKTKVFTKLEPTWDTLTTSLAPTDADSLESDVDLVTGRGDLSSLSRPKVSRADSFHDSAISGCSDGDYTGYETSGSSHSRGSKYDHVAPRVSSFRSPGELDALRERAAKYNGAPKFYRKKKDVGSAYSSDEDSFSYNGLFSTTAHDVLYRLKALREKHSKKFPEDQDFASGKGLAPLDPYDSGYHWHASSYRQVSGAADDFPDDASSY